MDREAWHAVSHGVAKSRTQLSNWTELNWTEWLMMPNIFLVFICCVYRLFSEMSVHVFCPFLLDCVFLLLTFKSLYISSTLVLCDICDLQIFSPSLQLLVLIMRSFAKSLILMRSIYPFFLLWIMLLEPNLWNPHPVLDPKKLLFFLTETFII